MKDEKRMEMLKKVVISINIILMVTTMVLQIFAFNTIRHVILCGCVLLLSSVQLVFDIILKDSNGFSSDITILTLFASILIMRLSWI
jgi:hypothetical protein